MAGRRCPGIDADTLVARIAGQLRPGSIVLLHDALHSAENTRAFDRTPTLDAVAQLLQMYDGRYEFVTVPDLLSRGRPQLSTWDRPPKLAWLNTLNRAEDLSRAPNRQ